MKYADKQVRLLNDDGSEVLLCFSNFASALQVSLSVNFPPLLSVCWSVSFSQCADEAMAVLHGRVVNGVKMKVMLADPPREESHKRPRTY